MSSKEEKISSFDPNGLALPDANLFGLPFNEDESDLIVLPVPWEVTVSYRTGTARAPKAILQASRQVDLYDHDVPDAWKSGIYMKKENKDVRKLSKQLRKITERYLNFLNEGGVLDDNKDMQKLVAEVNDGGRRLKNFVSEEIFSVISSGKFPALLGGDHSTPLGFMEALSKKYSEFGILQIDAHCDLRNAYEGFEFSHASIMFNALKIPQLKKLVQVGIRDYCQEEADVIRNENGRVIAFFDADMKRDLFEGKNWKSICDKIVDQLPPLVYISFDIDGLDPKLCPNTGTPVAGGLEFEQAVYLILQVANSGKKIIGFDLNEVAPSENEWDANVGARMLYKMCNLMAKSNRKNS